MHSGCHCFFWRAGGSRLVGRRTNLEGGIEARLVAGFPFDEPVFTREQPLPGWNPERSFLPPTVTVQSTRTLTAPAGEPGARVRVEA